MLLTVRSSPTWDVYNRLTIPLEHSSSARYPALFIAKNDVKRDKKITTQWPKIDNTFTILILHAEIDNQCLSYHAYVVGILSNYKVVTFK